MALLRAWHLPESLQEAVAHHHFPSSAQKFPLEAATVHLADSISHKIIFGSDSEPEKYFLTKSAWYAVQLSEDLHLQQIIEQAEDQLEEVSQIFLQTV